MIMDNTWPTMSIMHGMINLPSRFPHRFSTGTVFFTREWYKRGLYLIWMVTVTVSKIQKVELLVFRNFCWRQHFSSLFQKKKTVNYVTSPDFHQISGNVYLFVVWLLSKFELKPKPQTDHFRRSEVMTINIFFRLRYGDI